MINNNSKNVCTDKILVCKRAFCLILRGILRTMANKKPNIAKVRLLQPDISAEMGCDVTS